MIVDEFIDLIARHEISQIDAVPQDGLAGSALRHQPELQMFAAVRALSLSAGYSEFESDKIASAVMTRLG
ncbi:hypothetical protein Q3A80_28480 [Burkholderia sp. SR8]|jgi:hypothetical protein|uniref:hypothetical protein n=1 Tax=Burkholderia sp. SR8 TaxID=3062277 RepID=UPI0040628DA1